MCLALLPASLVQHFHSYGMDSEIPELHYHLHIVFCIGHNFETIISGEMLGTPTHVTLLWCMTTLVRKHISIISILFDNNKHHYRN